MPNNHRVIMLVAGERSGDVYGGWLAAELKRREPEIDLFGCSGGVMRAAGVETVVDAHEFAMVGITEVISGLPRAYRAFNQLVREAAKRRPDTAVLIDSPSLNMRLAKRLKRLGIPVVYFVSPQIWAWKKWRLRQLRSLVDRMICIFDFEPEIYHRAGIPAEYCGHPLAGRVAPAISRDEFYAKSGLDPATPTVALLPGSRKIELSYILPGLLEAASALLRKLRVQFVLPVAPGLDRRLVEEYAGRIPAFRASSGALHVVEEATYEALAYSKAAVLASGTATVEAALLERPMVVVYRVAPVTAFLARRMVDVPFFSMVNILAGKRIVPELIQHDFTPARVEAEVAALLGNHAAFEQMANELRAVKARLGTGGAVSRVADTVMAMAAHSATINRLAG